MASTQRIPGYHRRKTSGQAERQAAKTHEIVLLIITAIAFSTLLSGCRSGRTATSASATSSLSFREASADPDLGKQHPSSQAEFDLVSFDDPGKNEVSTAASAEQVNAGADAADRFLTGGDFPDPPTAQESEPTAPISLDQVLDSVEQCYPAIEITFGEIESANGKLLAAWGNFDSVFAAHSISQPLGFYQNYRNGLGMKRPLYNGGEVYGSYRMGDGDFEPWFGERETNEGGEFKAGFSLPILKDRAIDARRAAVRSAGANRDQVVSDVESRLLQFQRLATQSFWDWVASGRVVQIQQRLLELAQIRVDQINERVAKGDLAKLAQIDNDRFIAKRNNEVVKARRAMEKTAIKLSLFLRDQSCQPVIVRSQQLPTEFPLPTRIANDQRDADIASATSFRPELMALAAERRQACIALEYAKNLTLPKLDMKGYAGQDIGGDASSKGDKTPFQMQVGVYAEVPVQRREALGKIRAARGKISQIDAKSRLITDKIRAEIQDAASAVNAALDQIEQSQKNVELTRRSLELGRQSFDAGDIDLISLNIYETSVADAELQLLDAQFKYFYFLAVYETARSARAFQPQG